MVALPRPSSVTAHFQSFPRLPRYLGKLTLYEIRQGTSDDLPRFSPRPARRHEKRQRRPFNLVSGHCHPQTNARVAGNNVSASYWSSPARWLDRSGPCPRCCGERDTARCPGRRTPVHRRAAATSRRRTASLHLPEYGSHVRHGPAQLGRPDPALVELCAPRMFSQFDGDQHSLSLLIHGTHFLPCRAKSLIQAYRSFATLRSERGSRPAVPVPARNLNWTPGRATMHQPPTTVILRAAKL